MTEIKTQRPPVVVVVGHVDHGKTTLLDHIRKSNVAAREAGGITQGVSAYEITHAGRRITFIDTPGHEAFSNMRSRGATIADLAILVVAADEGIKPQTKEAIKILQETGTPFVVALNKIDRPGANIEKMKQELAENGVLLEGYGGQISFQPISAKSGEGVNDLLDLVLLTADVTDLPLDLEAPASGYVLEARMSTQRGIEVVVIVTNGTLRVGDVITAGPAKGKVKMLEDFMKKSARELSASAPAIIVGFETLPSVGEKFTTGTEASAVVRVAEGRPAHVPAYTQVKAPTDQLTLVLKAGDAGSLEALTQIIGAMTFERPIKIVSGSVGDVTDNDVKLAISTKAAIVGFKSKVSKAAAILAESNKIAIVTDEIIYKLLEVIEQKLAAAQGPQLVAALEVLAVFNQARLDKQLVGGKVSPGPLKQKSGQLQIERDGKKIGTGKIISMREKKNDVAIIEEGHEGGIVVNTNIAIAVGDRLGVYEER
jgi:translation initiation factor IF-2